MPFKLDEEYKPCGGPCIFIGCDAALCFTPDCGCAHLHALNSMSVVAYKALVHAVSAAAGALYKVHVCMFGRRPDSVPIGLASSRPHVHVHKYAVCTRLRPVILMSEQIRCAAITALDRARAAPDRH